MASNTGSALTSSASSILNIYQNYLNIKNLKDYTKTQIANMASATDSFKNSADNLYLQYQQQREQAAYNLEQSTLANMKAKGTAQASAASAGVAGNSINNLFRGYDRAIAVDNYIQARNLQNTYKQYTNELGGLKANAINAINSYSSYSQNNFNSASLNSLSSITDLLSQLRLKNSSTNTYSTRIDTASLTGGYA